MTISFAFAAAAAVAFAAIAWSDLRSWRIPNGHVLLVLVLGLLRLAGKWSAAALPTPGQHLQVGKVRSFL